MIKKTLFALCSITALSIQAGIAMAEYPVTFPKIVQTIQLPGRGHIALNPVTRRLYACSDPLTSIAVYDLDTLVQLATVTTSGSHTGIQVDPIDNKIYFTEQGTARLKAIDGTNNTIVYNNVVPGSSVMGIVIDTDTKKLYINRSSNANLITFITTSSVFQSTIAASSNISMVYMAVDPGAHRLYFSKQASNKISVVNTLDDTYISTINAPNSPGPLTINPVTQTLYVANGSDTVHSVNVSNGQILSTTSVQNSPNTILAHPTRNRVYIGEGLPQTIAVLDGQTNGIIARVQLSGLPQMIIRDPVTDRLFVLGLNNKLDVVREMPYPPRNLVATPISNTGVQLDWLASTGNTVANYRVYFDSGTGTINYSNIIATVAFGQNTAQISGLVPGVNYKFAVRSLDTGALEETNTTVISSTVTLAISPGRPSNFIATALTNTQIRLDWTASTTTSVSKYWIFSDSNTGTINYNTAIATIAAPTLTWTSSALPQNTLYMFGIRAVDGIAETNTNVTATTRTVTLPQPPQNLAATALSTAPLIRLDWDASPSTTVVKYWIFSDSATGTIDYNTIRATISVPGTSWTSYLLPVDTVYKFGIRAVDTKDVSDLNTSIVATTRTVTFTTLAWTRIKSPKSGHKVSGNRMLVSAEVLPNSPTLSQVRFEYQPAGVSSWTLIPAANVNHPNPDTSAPYFTHWNVSQMAEGTYKIRSVGTNTSGDEEQIPSSSTIIIDNSNPDVLERNGGNSDLEKKEKLDFSTVHIASVQAAADNRKLTEVRISSKALNSSTDTITLTINPSGVTPPKSKKSLGEYRDFTLQSGQTRFNEDVVIVLSYADDDQDGLVDGTSIKEKDLDALYFNTSSGNWEKDFTTVVDTRLNTLTIYTRHFSVYGIFAPGSALTLNAIRLYPNPYVPDDGNDNNGKPYTSGDTTTGVIFENLTSKVGIKIYAVTGALVLDAALDTPSGQWRWDGRDSSGNDVATGIYVAVVKDSSTNQKVTKKFAVVR